MLEQLKFVLKTTLVTFLVVTALQVRVGDMTAEQQALRWYQGSVLVLPMQTVVDGGVRLIRVSWQASIKFLSIERDKFRHHMKTNFKRQPPAPETSEESESDTDSD